MNKQSEGNAEWPLQGGFSFVRNVSRQAEPRLSSLTRAGGWQKLNFEMRHKRAFISNDIDR
jgi:hypothetical protein